MYHIKTNYAKLMMLFMALMLSVGSKAQAQNLIDPPVDLSVKVELAKTNPPIEQIILNWKAGDASNTIQYGIYAKYSSDSGSTWTDWMYASMVTHNFDAVEQSFMFSEVIGGTYQFYVTAYGFDGNNNAIFESAPSSTVEVTVNGRTASDKYLYLTDQYIEMKPGETFTQILRGWGYTNLDCEINYSVEKSEIDYIIADDNSVIYITPKEEGSYMIEINAVADCDANVTATAYLNVYVSENANNWGHIQFDTLFQQFFMLSKDNLFEYKISASSTKEECGIKYSISPKPDFADDMFYRYAEGATIDAKSGELTWTPTEAGSYFLLVKIALDCDLTSSYAEEMEVGLYFDVYDGEVPGLGNVKFILRDEETKEFISYGSAQLWGMDTLRTNTGFCPMNYYAYIVDGEGTTQAFEGKYLAYAEAQGYMPEWYEDATDIANAKEVEITKDGNLEITMYLKKLPTPNMVKVSGRVITDDTEEGMYSWVEFMPIELIFGNGKDYLGYTEYLRNLYVETDQDGYYTIEVPDVFTFVAMATPLKEQLEYLGVYYGGASSPYEADLISVKNGELSGIDFRLKKWTNTLSSINGSVQNEQGEAVSSQVIAMMDNEQSRNGYSYISVVNTDDSGNFKFENMPYGNYILLSLPNSADYVPGYYSANATASLKWKDATIVSVDDAATTLYYTIKHASTESAAGLAGLTGTVTKNAGITTGKDGVSASKEVLSGAMLYLVDAQGKVAQYTMSTGSGKFNFDNVANGTYTLLSDKAGFINFEKTITIAFDKNNPVVTTDVVLTQDATSDVEDEFELSNVAVYPMPVRSAASVTFESKGGATSLELTNSAGAVVLETSINTIEGTNTYNLDANMLNSGAYFLTIKNGTFTETIPVSVVK